MFAFYFSFFVIRKIENASFLKRTQKTPYKLK